MATYYVRQNGGSDRDAGSTPHLAFKTLARGVNALAPRDTLIVGPGEYDPQAIDKIGVTIRSEIKHKAIIDGDADYGFLVRAPHVTIEGFDVRGIKDGAGIHVSSTHHVLIKGNKVHDVEGTGIFAARSDYLTIDGNEVYACDSDRATSAISIFQPQETVGYKNWWARLKVINNHIHDNGRPATAGSDDFAFIYDNNPRVEYAHKLLVKNNLFHDNAKGMLFFNADDFVACGNIGYHNGPSEFQFRHSIGAAYGNVAVAEGEGATFLPLGSRVTFRNNVSWHEDRDKNGLAPDYPVAPSEMWDFRDPGFKGPPRYRFRKAI